MNGDRRQVHATRSPSTRCAQKSKLVGQIGRGSLLTCPGRSWVVLKNTGVVPVGRVTISHIVLARPHRTPLVSLVLARRSSLVLCLSRPHSLVLAPRPRHSSSLVLAALLARPRPPLVLTHPRCSSSLVLAARPRSSSSSPLVLGRRRRSSSVVVVARPRSSSPLVLSHASSLTRPLSLILIRSSSLARPRSLILSRSSSLPCPQTCPRHVAPRARASPTRFGRSLLCQAKRASQNPFVGSRGRQTGSRLFYLLFVFAI
jgi:hypothetical protein